MELQKESVDLDMKIMKKVENSVTQLLNHWPKSKESFLANPDGTFTCTICNNVVKHQRNLTRHIQTVHEKLRPFQCAVCQSCFESKQILERHFQSYHEGKNQNLNNPMKKIHDENNDQGKNIKNSLSDIGDYSQKFQCSRCDVILKEKARLKRHEEISRSVKNIQTCNECKFRSCTSMGLKNWSHKCSKTNTEQTEK